jgi:hypothetical protein
LAGAHRQSRPEWFWQGGEEMEENGWGAEVAFWGLLLQSTGWERILVQNEACTPGVVVPAGKSQASERLLVRGQLRLHI